MACNVNKILTGIRGVDKIILMNRTSNESGKGGKTVGRRGIYAKFEPHAQKAIDTLVVAMEKGNWATKVGAAKVILAKLIPDLKAVEHDPEKIEQLRIKIINEPGSNW